MPKKSRFGYKSPIPQISSRKGTTKQVSFTDGRDTYSDNDDVKPTALVEAIDARWIKKGRYITRQGLDRYTTPAGAALNVQQTSVAGASLYTVDGTHAFADKFTLTATGRITRTDINIKSTATSKGVLLVEVYSDSAGTIGSLLARSSIRPSEVLPTLSYITQHYHAGPLKNTGEVVWVVVKGQNEDVGQYQLSTTTAVTTGMQSSTAGAAWSTTTFGANFKIYSAPSQPVKGLTRSYRPNGTKLTSFFYGTSMANVNDGTGAITAVKTDFNASASKYRTQMVQDALYIVNGVEKPWKYDFTTFSQISTPYTPSLIIEHQGLLFMNDVDDKSRMFYSNFADYGTYTSTDFIYVPAPKSYDGITAFGKLNGALYPFARRNKFVLLGTDNDTFTLDEAPDQRGTFSQESLVYDANFIFHADEDGVHQFNGTDSRNLAENFLEEYRNIPDKSSINLDLYNNRLYVFYTPAGAAANTECIVYNLVDNIVESRDLNTPIGRTFGRYAQDNIFIQASNLTATLYYGELDSNDYHNLGDQLQYELRTSYSDLDAPGAPKSVPKWNPQFPSVSGVYPVQVGYDLDLQGTPVFQDVQISGSGPRYNTGVRFNTGVKFPGQRMIEPKLYIPGEFNRVQRRYKHVAAREPVEFDSEVMAVEVQRIE